MCDAGISGAVEDMVALPMFDSNIAGTSFRRCVLFVLFWWLLICAWEYMLLLFLVSVVLLLSFLFFSLLFRGFLVYWVCIHLFLINYVSLKKEKTCYWDINLSNFMFSLLQQLWSQQGFGVWCTFGISGTGNVMSIIFCWENCNLCEKGVFFLSFLPRILWFWLFKFVPPLPNRRHCFLKLLVSLRISRFTKREDQATSN